MTGLQPFPSLSLVIPCYNESGRMSILFRGLEEFEAAWQQPLQVIIVDDGSTDDTLGLLQQYQAAYTGSMKLQVLSQANTGKGGALKRGIASVEHDLVLTLDADMATPPLQLLQWLDMQGHFPDKEVWIASRDLGSSKVKDSLKRKFVGNVFNRIIRNAVGLDIHDTQCGFKLYPAIIAGKVFSELQTEGWAHDVEILLRVKKLQVPIIEMPVQWEAVKGSKIEVLRDSWRMFWEVMRIRGMKI